MIQVLAAVIDEVAALLTKASDSYYNTSKFLPTTEKDKKLLQRLIGVSPAKVTDRVFDALIDWVKEENPKHPILKKIGAPVQVKTKVQLPLPMGSLNKLRTDTGGVVTWAEKNPGPYVVSDKMDGTSILLEYSKGSLKCYTRGNGTIGQDISYLAPHFNIPQQLSSNMIIRGEVIMSKAKFANWSHEYENARNLASGMVNKKGVHDALKDVEVIVYAVMEPRGVPSKQLADLKAKGFKVVPFKVYEALGEAMLDAILTKRISSNKYDIDGIVVGVDKKTKLPAFGSNPTTAFAFKSLSQGDNSQSKVIAIHWAVSKNGMIKPRIEIEPVRLDGVTVKFATAFNAKFVADNKLGPGSIVEIVRSGGVIPTITKVIKSTKAQMPIGIEYEWNASGVDLVITEEGHADQETKRITSFFVKEALVRKFGEDWYAELETVSQEHLNNSK